MNGGGCLEVQDDDGSAEEFQYRTIIREGAGKHDFVLWLQ